MRQLDVLPSDFKLASYNFDLVKKTVGAHGIPTSVAGVLFDPIWSFTVAADEGFKAVNLTGQEYGYFKVEWVRTAGTGGSLTSKAIVKAP